MEQYLIVTRKLPQVFQCSISSYSDSLLAYLREECPGVEGGGGAGDDLPEELVQCQGQLAWGRLHPQAQGRLRLKKAGVRVRVHNRGAPLYTVFLTQESLNLLSTTSYLRLTSTPGPFISML